MRILRVAHTVEDARICVVVGRNACFDWGARTLSGALIDLVRSQQRPMAPHGADPYSYLSILDGEALYLRRTDKRQDLKVSFSLDAICVYRSGQKIELWKDRLYNFSNTH